MVLFGLNSALLLLQRVGTVPAIFLSLAGTAFYLASIFTLRDAQGRFFGQRASAGLPPFCLLLVSGLAWLTGPPSGRFAQLFEALTLLVLSVAPFLAERL
uniref:Uncharacterized protein n=1 Tax=Thermogemmatispora argillosa TaxID=2045280 RepID=A0A455SZF7_9CHLR|nr:hypothetical protein KTA_06680 [Thermogemmatispora argillosa]